MYVRMRMHVRVWKRGRVYITYVCMYIYKYICIHAHAYACACIEAWTCVYMSGYLIRTYKSTISCTHEHIQA